MSERLRNAIQQARTAKAELDEALAEAMPSVLPNASLGNYRSETCVLAAAGGFDMRLQLGAIEALLGSD